MKRPSHGQMQNTEAFVKITSYQSRSPQSHTPLGFLRTFLFPQASWTMLLILLKRRSQQVFMSHLMPPTTQGGFVSKRRMAPFALSMTSSPLTLSPSAMPLSPHLSTNLWKGWLHMLVTPCSTYMFTTTTASSMSPLVT